MRRIFFSLALLFALPAWATQADHGADRLRVEQYLTGLTSLVADFSQVDANGKTSTGKFFLKRPGKMRWQYHPPTPILLVSNGKTITYYDADLDQVNYLGIDDSLASFLAEPVIKLESATTRLTEFTSAANMIRATIVRKNKSDQGSLTLEFSDKPLQIRRILVKDATNRETTIQLQNAQFGVVLPDKLFTFEDPRGLGRRRAR